MRNNEASQRIVATHLDADQAHFPNDIRAIQIRARNVNTVK